MQATNIPDFQLYDQALIYVDEKKRNNQPFLPPTTIINTLNNMATNMPVESYNYHCYNIYRLLAVNMLRTSNNLKQLSSNFKKVQMGTAILTQNLSPAQFEILSIYIEYYQ